MRLVAAFSPRIAFGIVFIAFIVRVKSDDTCDIEIENTLKTLLAPQETPSIQLQALRKYILHRFADALDRPYDDLPVDKRNLEALARAGYIRTLPELMEDDKRSLANLAKNGQLPADLMNNESKRGIESLARSGELSNRRLLDALYSKRNVGSLARNFNWPHEAADKRNLASIVRQQGKRNVAAMLRQDNYLMNRQQEAGRGGDMARQLYDEQDKRNIGSIKAQSRFVKRSAREKREIEADEEYPQPVYQNGNGYDYEELMKELTGFYPDTEKRFLGSVAKSGWFRPAAKLSPEKRHIGSLARLGWLPTLRNIRRFQRSGRSTYDDRSLAADGQAEDDAVAQDAAVSLDAKRFLLQPAVDNILLRRLYMMHPRTHSFISKP